jgi:VanZ family protein
MGVIFAFSARQRVSVGMEQEPLLNFLIFKTFHVIEYAILYFLLFRGYYSLQDKNWSLPQKLLIPFIVAMLYAATDEFHQTLSPHREGTPRDVIIDTIGIFIMYSYIKRNIPFVKKFI